MGFVDSRNAQTVIVGLSEELGLELDIGERNYLRDWDRMRDFAHRLVDQRCE